ncbi:hypothetical protein MATL_G00084250 [Megalops atlanticus]|uniref:Uncharacterized protein n=1 Tax=Megalops atlanticus TaxID=7932 RepID=A0A9D3Q5T6_MEGAT|nr:hypothetical protein MATL_G00084250 [Megalops atlanticus]
MGLTAREACGRSIGGHSASVEHDFRLQEGQFTRAWRIAEASDSDHSSPQTAGPTPPPAPRREDSPLPARPHHAAKKSRRKCFWFL